METRRRVFLALVVVSSLTAARELSAQTIDKSSGFANSSGLTSVGSNQFAPAAAPTVARLTPGSGSLAGAFWSSTTVDIRMFTNTFTFQMTPGSTPIADGMTFTIQNMSGTAIGANGGNLGYQGITSSVCLTLDTYNGSGTPSLSDVFSGGVFPDSTASVAPLDFHTYRVFRCDMNYDGSVLAVQLTDTTNSQSVSRNFTVDIPTLVGGNTAYVGFTAGTGGYTANHDVLTWKFDSIVTPPAPTGVNASAGTPPPYGVVDVTYNASTGAASYTIKRSTSPTGPFTTVGTSTTTSFQDTTATPGATYYYVVSATNPAGTSADSAPSNAVTAVPRPPKTGGGGGRDSCGCGTTSAPGPALLAALAAATLWLLALTGKRRAAPRP